LWLRCLARGRGRETSPRTVGETWTVTGGLVEANVEAMQLEAVEARWAEATSEVVEAALPEALAAALKEAGERLTEAMRHLVTIRVPA
jgi:hypothetical protein